MINIEKDGIFHLSHFFPSLKFTIFLSLLWSILFGSRHSSDIGRKNSLFFILNFFFLFFTSRASKVCKILVTNVFLKHLRLEWRRKRPYVCEVTYIHTCIHDYILSRIYRVAKKLISSRKKRNKDLQIRFTIKQWILIPIWHVTIYQTVMRKCVHQCLQVLTKKPFTFMHVYECIVDYL